MNKKEKRKNHSKSELLNGYVIGCSALLSHLVRLPLTLLNRDGSLSLARAVVGFKVESMGEELKDYGRVDVQLSIIMVRSYSRLCWLEGLPFGEKHELAHLKQLLQYLRAKNQRLPFWISSCN